MEADFMYSNNSKCYTHSPPKEQVCVPILHWIMQIGTPKPHVSR